MSGLIVAQEGAGWDGESLPMFRKAFHRGRKWATLTPMIDPLPRLQELLRERYAVERVLGRGGMAVVYLARDLKHDRQVALKVLRSDLAATLGPESFLREIQVTARLQHPLILPLHDSGRAEEFLYYVMPYVEGESLRDRLIRERQLPVADAVRIARDVAEALGYAHERGVVHRDVKPENILLTGGHAVVADFGIARAIQVAADATTVVRTDLVSGTPAYMSPEQATGSEVDGRTDVYSLGVVLYEMLAGAPPFVEPTAQALLKRILADPPPSLKEKRPSVPEPLEAAVQTALEKLPADRFSTATELRAVLEGIASDTGRTRTQSGIPAVSLPSAAPIEPAGLIRVVALFAGASALVLAGVYFLVRVLGLPDWVFPAAVGLLVVGLPILVIASVLQNVRGGSLARWLTLRNAVLGGALAFAFLAITVIGYGVSRKTGVGPAASLVSAGILSERDQVLVADFENATPDSSLDETVKEALSVDLAQSSTIVVVPASKVAEALSRMEKEAATPLSPELARDLAQREGIKAIVTGSILGAGKGYVLSAKLLEPAGGTVLAAYREGADDPGQVIGAIDRLSNRMREKIGESLKTIRANPPLQAVTTSSLEALRKYSQGVRAIEYEGDTDKSIALLTEAVTLDTTFAMAYRKLGTVLSNRGREPARAQDALTQAYRHRNRLPERERYLAEGSYYMTVSFEREKALQSYQRLLELDPHDAWALNNLAVMYLTLGDPSRALEVFQRARQVEESPLTLGNVASAQTELGQYEEAARTLVEYASKYPDNTARFVAETSLAAAQWKFHQADSLALVFLNKSRESPFDQAQTHFLQGALASAQGQLERAGRESAAARSLAERAGLSDMVLFSVLIEAGRDALVRDDPKRGITKAEAALAVHPLESLSPVERPYEILAVLYAYSGDMRRARSLLQEAQTVLPPQELRGREMDRHQASAVIALGEGKPGDAVQEILAGQAENPGDRLAGLVILGRAYEGLGKPDSALAVYERFLDTPSDGRFFEDQFFLGGALVRAGELREARGDAAKALEHYTRFVEIWKNADPDLQGRVRAVQLKIRALAGGGT